MGQWDSKMAAIEKRSGNWGAKVRKSGRSLSKTFTKKSDAISWAVEAERSINLRLPLSDNQCTSLGDVLERYARDVVPLKRGGPKEICKIGIIRRHQVTEIAITDLTPYDSHGPISLLGPFSVGHFWDSQSSRLGEIHLQFPHETDTSLNMNIK